MNTRSYRSLLAAVAIPLALGVATPASANTSLGNAIAGFAKARLGKCVDRSLQTRSGPCPTLQPGQVGDGECTDLAMAALKSVNAKPRSNYVWGHVIFQGRPGAHTLSRDYFDAGDILQFWNATFKSPDGSSWTTGSPGHHTAIIFDAYRWPLVQVLEQNNNYVRAVTHRTIDLSTLQSGYYFVYRAEPAGPVPGSVAQNATLLQQMTAQKAKCAFSLTFCRQACPSISPGSPGVETLRLGSHELGRGPLVPIPSCSPLYRGNRDLSLRERRCRSGTTRI